MRHGNLVVGEPPSVGLGHAPPPRLARTLAALEVVLGASAIAGGTALVQDPTGRTLGLPTSLLWDSPFADYLVPGWTLLLAVGLPALLGVAASLKESRWAGLLGSAVGVLVMGFITLQIYWTGTVVALQGVMLVLGLCIAVLGNLMRFEQDDAG